jgi:hypothetical protein
VNPNTVNPVLDPPADSPSLLLASCERLIQRTGGVEELRTSVEFFHGNPYVSIRVFYRDRFGEMKPTRRGVSVRIGEIETVMAALAEARDLLTSEPVADHPNKGPSSAGAPFVPRLHRPDDDGDFYYQGEATDQ